MSWDVIGMGAVAALGENPEQIFAALCAGRSGLAPLRTFDRGKYGAQRAYEIDDRPDGRDEPGRATRWLRAAVAQALADARLRDPGFAAAEFAQLPVLVGTTLRELRSAELWWRDGARLEPADLHFARAMREAFGTVRTETIASACAASLYALGMGTDLLELGECDAVVVAGTDAITESSYGGLDRVQRPAPEALRPFDRNRRGMLMGEGAVAVVLRRADTRPCLARVRGVSMGCDAVHPTAPDPAGIARAVREAHERAAVKPGEIDLVVVHGSGTPRNDAVESQVLREVFADADPYVTAIKGGVGHTCGGSGLLSLVMAVLAMRHSTVPPIAGLTDPDPAAAGLRLVADRPLTAPLGITQINAFGLGGINAVAVVEAAA